MDAVSRWAMVLAEAGGDGLMLCLKLLAILAPLMIAYELAKAYGLFDRPWNGLRPLLAGIGLSPGSLVPLLAGLFLGLFYGAGILISMSKEQGLGRQERLALAVFLVTCHAVVEDTAIFVLLGGSAMWMLGPRLILAIALCAWLARRAKRTKT